MTGETLAELLALHRLRRQGDRSEVAHRTLALARAAGADRRLAVYGSLAPGKENAHQLAGLAGRWREGTVRGHLLDRGWGAGLGFPALVWDPRGAEVPVQLFESVDLPLHWARLDAFEGPGYERILVPVACGDGVVVAFLYALAGT